MNNEIVNPSKGKELRDLARSNPEKAYKYLEENKQLWIQIATKDPFDSADVLEEHEDDGRSQSTEDFASHARKLCSYLCEVWCCLRAYHIRSLPIDQCACQPANYCS